MEEPRKKKNKHNAQPEYKNLNPFKEMEKHFKLYHNRVTDFSVVFEPKEYENVDGFMISHLPYPEGAILVKQFNPPETVLEVAAKSLNVFCKKPYRTNLDSRDQLYKEETKQPAKEEEQPKQEVEQTAVQDIKQEAKGYHFNEKIRWANVGYQYDWTERKYPNMKTEIPEVIHKISERANKLYNAIRKDSKNYYPESAIINYYGEKDYMTGHLDDAQVDQLSPIYSFSFGLDCIFLIGGRTKDQKPIAVRLQSGDLLIMGLQARKCYHGVPRILSQTFQSQPQEIHLQPNWPNNHQNITNYLSTHRININVRQVYPTED